MDMNQQLCFAMHRRNFLQNSSTGIGAIALASLLKPTVFASDNQSVPGALKRLHFAPKAKRIIYLFMSGAPSQLDLFDPKPTLTEMTGIVLNRNPIEQRSNSIYSCLRYNRIQIFRIFSTGTINDHQSR